MTKDEAIQLDRNLDTFIGRSIFCLKNKTYNCLDFSQIDRFTTEREFNRQDFKNELKEKFLSAVKQVNEQLGDRPFIVNQSSRPNYTVLDSVIVTLMRNPNIDNLSDKFSALLDNVEYKEIYPECDCDLIVWKFMKKEIDRNTQKYEAQAKRMLTNRQKQYQSDQTDQPVCQTESNITQTQKSSGQSGDEPGQYKEMEGELNKTKIKERKENAQKILGRLAQSMNPNAPKTYEINDEFSFDALYDDDDAIKDLYIFFPAAKINRAERSLRNKKCGERFTLQQLKSWIEREGNY
jgi:hypothetical protein